MASMIRVLLFAIAMRFLYLFVSRKEYFVHSNGGYIIITGASTGIGRHAAEYIAYATNFTVLAGVRNNDDFNSIKNMGVTNLVPLLIDVNSQWACESAKIELERMMGKSGLPLVALVNNAGRSSSGLVEYLDIEKGKELYETNVFGVLRVTQLFLPLLRESKGRIVMVSSVSSFLRPPLKAIYSSSKAALDAITDTLRREVDEFGVAVSNIQPAYVQSEIHNKLSVADGRNYDGVNEQRFHEKVKKIKDSASSPVVTSEAIHHAIFARNPKTYYRVASAVGIPAPILFYLQWLLPDRVIDFIIAMANK